MKIGDAGEAFFVFETEDDVPADLITSPIIRPTRPDESKDAVVGLNDQRDRDAPRATGEEAQEPEFLDLDAGPSGIREENIESSNPPSIAASSLPNVKPSDDSSAKSLQSQPPSTPPSPPSASLSSQDVQFKDSKCELFNL